MSATLPQIATFIKPANSLSDEFMAQAQQLMREAGAQETQTQWLKQGTAFDIGFAGGIDKEKMVSWSDSQGADCIIQPSQGRLKKLFISDMDSTLITVECIDELADFVGKKDHVSAITERAMRGELDFESALTERVALLKGLPEATLQECYDSRVTMMPGARELAQAMRQSGARCVVVSGGFTFFTSRVREELGFHADFSNRLEIANGTLTGRVLPPILGKEAKLATLQAECTQLGISPAEALAIGDGANDLPMLLAAGLGVAYHAKPLVQQQAGARLNHCDLSALIFTQGLN